MNEQSSKKLLFNKSSLLSLKAELLRKQEEVHEKKHLPQHKLELFKPPKASNKNVKDADNVEKKSFRDNLNKAVDTDELEACRKSKLALEKKAKLYEHLSDKSGNSELSSRFLVDFDSKKQQDSPAPSPPPEPEDVQDNEDDDEWTEYTDCLGRSRKCLKSDLELYVKRDRELMGVMAKDRVVAENIAKEDTTSSVEKPLLVQKTNDYLQSLREKWEQKEQELLAKDKDIHYQDILFDEARQHGVGYFSFSTDEAERKRQMEELMKRRQETLTAQQQTEEQRKKRDELMAARVAAARARQRTRAGLPPEEPKKENEKDFTTCLLEFLTQQKNEADAKAKEKEKKIREEEEKERQKLRDAYVREWDIGKDGVEGKVKKFREMTQEEYVEQQRAKRIKEFAPTQSTSSDMSSYSFDEKGRMRSADGDSAPSKTWIDTRPKTPPPPSFRDVQPGPSKSWDDVRPKVKTPPPPIICDLEPERKGLYFSSRKPECKRDVQYKNFVKSQEATPIENELSEEEVCDEREKQNNKRRLESNHAEVAPPPTYDYYGPIPKKGKNQKPFESDIKEAYAQGSKSLETKVSSRRLPQHYDFTFD